MKDKDKDKESVIPPWKIQIVTKVSSVRTTRGGEVRLGEVKDKDKDTDKESVTP